jgi:GTP1/Obg family GTP-binding protein
MQAITALAHLRACVLFIMDPSGQCGHNIEDQVHLFESVKPLFANKVSSCEKFVRILFVLWDGELQWWLIFTVS